MKLREKALKALWGHGFIEDQAVKVLDLYLNSPHTEEVRRRIDDEESDYPPQFFIAIWSGLKRTALDWIDTNAPNHWARPLLE